MPRSIGLVPVVTDIAATSAVLEVSRGTQRLVHATRISDLDPKTNGGLEVRQLGFCPRACGSTVPFAHDSERLLELRLVM